MERISRRLRTILTEFVNFILRIVGFIPSHHVRRFFYRISGVKIGKGSAIHMGAVFYDPKNIKIGKDSIIGEGAVLDGRDKLTIGNHVDIASEVMIYNCQHDVQSPDFKAVCAPVEIGDYVFIGPRAIILPGVNIKKGAVIGAGAEEKKGVDEFEIVGGVPAKQIKEKIKDLNYKLGRAAW